MPIITDIVEQQRNKSRSNIYVDNVFFSGASNFIIRTHRLHIGKEVQKDELEAILFEDSVEKAKGYIIDYHLNKSMKIIQDKLVEKGYDERVIEQVIDFLERYHIINDGEYAKKKSKDLSRLSQKGPRVIAQTLRKNGISEEDIQQALEEIGEEDQVEMATKALRKKLATYKKKAKNHYDFRQKCYAFLMGKGFTGNVINEVLTNLEREENEDV